MKISELSRVSGVSVPTIKYYIREGLLPPGRQTTAPNQADYATEHEQLLRLIRTLTEVGGLSIGSVRTVITTLGDQRASIHELLGTAHRALPPILDDHDPPADLVEARADVDAYLTSLGWEVSAEAPARRMLAQALVSLRRLGRDVDASVFDPYAEAADTIAKHELASIAPEATRAQIVEAAIVGTVVFEHALVALRRLAQARHSAKRFS